MAAAAAERERRKSAAVEEEKRLLAAPDRGLHRLRQPRRNEASARRTLALEIDRLDARKMLAAETLRQMQLLVAAAARVHFRFHRRRRRRQHDRNAAHVRTHHRHVAGVIAHAVLLLVGGVVLFIHDNHAEIGVRQEQRRARAHCDRRLARRHRRPGARAQPLRELRMPLRRPHAEAFGEAVEHLRGERDLRHQDQRLPAAADRFRHRLEIHRGLAGAGDAVEQRCGIAAFCDRLAQGIGGRALRRREIRLRETGIGRGRHRIRREHQRLQRALVDQAVDDAGRYAGLFRDFALAAHQPVGDHRQHAIARRGHAFGVRTGEPHADALARRAEMLTHAQRHADDHSARRQRIVRHPVHEFAQLAFQRRHLELVGDVLEPVVEAGVGTVILRPHHAQRLARAERHGNDVPGRHLHPGRHHVGIGLVERDRHQDIDDTAFHGRCFHGPISRDSPRLRKG